MQPRTIATIQQQIITQAQSYAVVPTDPFYYIFHNSNGVAITPSKANIFILITYIVAVSISLFEQIMYLFEQELEGIIAAAPVGTPQWIKAQALLFQYDATTPQVVQYDNTTNTISYPIVDPTKRIITQCSVVTLSNHVVLIKVNTAGGGVLSSPQLTAFNSYLNTILFAGVQENVISSLPDYLMVGVQIYFNGQYTPTITTDVPAAINNYLANLTYDGVIDLTSLEDAIQTAGGVIDVVFTQVELRANGVAPANAYVLVNNSTTIIRRLATYSGTAITDTASGRTLSATVQYIPQ